MNNARLFFRILFILLMPLAFNASSQVTSLDMSQLNAVPLTPANILSYKIYANAPAKVLLKGTVRFRNGGHYFSYSMEYRIEAGLNNIDASLVSPQWQFSSSALRSLFQEYGSLPQGAYEYCVTATPVSSATEATAIPVNECVYFHPMDVFLINLISPADKAKLKEHNPVLTWVANCSMVAELTYRLRIAEIKQGQNPQTAVLRNQPQFDERGLVQNSMAYPIYSKPLESNKPYAWTVDAYFRGILMGSSETWQFIIPEDSLQRNYPVTRSFVDVSRENNTSVLWILGELKLKYQLEKYRSDEFSVQLFDANAAPVHLKPEKLKINYGDNRYVMNLKDSCDLKHEREYKLILTSSHGERHELPFIYLNPEFVKQ